MREKCPMSCGYCDDDKEDKEDGGSCSNLHADCEYYKDQSYCTEGG